MQFPAWTRLCNQYSARIARLLAGEQWQSLAGSIEFRERADEVADAMVRQVATENAKSWRSAAYKSGRGRKIYEALQAELRRGNLQPYLNAIARRNANLIQSVPQKVALQVSEHAQALYLEGKRPAEIEAELKVVAPRLAKSHAALIARTSVSTAESQITEARALSINIPVYQWASSNDARVRKSHRNMDGVLVFFSDPPNPERLIGERSTSGPYHAGCIYNCRCLELPVISLDEIVFPARVFRNGNITRMRRAEFAALAGYRRAA